MVNTPRFSNFSTEPLRILYFEDNSIDGLLIGNRSRADRLSVEIVQVQCLAKGLDVLRQDHFDLILLDLSFSNKEFADLLQQVREASPRLPVIVLANEYDEAIAFELLGLGAQDYLVKKHLTDQKLYRSIRFAIERQRFLFELNGREGNLCVGEAAIRQIIEANADAIVVVDREGIVRYANPAAEDLFDIPIAEFVGASFGFPVVNGHPSELDIIRRDGSILIAEMRMVKAPWGDQLAYFASLRDITKRRNLEEQLRQTQKLEAIGTLTGGIAHDFNNILMAILGYTELAKRSSREAAVHKQLEMVIQAGQRANTLIKQILTFSRQESGERQVILLQDVVKESISMLRATLPATISISTNVASSVSSVFVDPGQVQQILLNLGSNARYAMKDCMGNLEIELRECTVDKSLAKQYPYLQPGDFVRISFSDNGCGMDNATIQRIFEPFFTTKPPGEGTGLGMSVIHGIMQSHEGAVTVDSRIGKGTTFRLYFPVFTGETSLEEQSKSMEISVDASLPHGHGERILFVDDEDLLTLLGRSFLNSLGYHVETCHSALDALELLREDPYRFDLVMTDQTMPGMTGLDFAREVLILNPDQRIVLSTGQTDKLTPELVKDRGIRELLPKPNTMEVLAKVVYQVLYKE